MIATDQPTIFDPAKLQVVVSSLSDGNMKYEKGGDVPANMAALAAKNGFDPKQYVVMLVDNADEWDVIREVRAADAGSGATTPDTRLSADALVTAQPGLALLLPIADCCPTVLYDSQHHVAALVHLGWKSSEANLLAKTIQYLHDTHATDPAQLVAYLGPCIQPTSYVFTDRPRQADAPAWQGFVRQDAAGWHIDIPGFNRQQLLTAGVPPQQIQISSVDTAVNAEYPSHYQAVREGQQSESRFAVVLALR